MRNVTAAVTQMSCSRDREENLQKAERLVRQAAEQGAQIILLQELFETQYFCQTQNFEYMDLARPLSESPAVKRLSALAKETETVIPVSFFERYGNTAFNSVAVLDADGSVLGIYRKTHIPDGLPYAEKFYFTPGDTGFRVWNTRYGKIGVGICWDQWFPEAARSMALLGAELLCYPTAIGSEPTLGIDSKDHWQRCMQGHAAGQSDSGAGFQPDRHRDRGESSMTFYGSSFITDETGGIVEEADRTTETVLVHTFDLTRLLCGAGNGAYSGTEGRKCTEFS